MRLEWTRYIFKYLEEKFLFIYPKRDRIYERESKLSSSNSQDFNVMD